MNIYFSDRFNVKPEVLNEYGAFNISLINDLPLFIDPFLLFTSKKPVYKQLHDQIIEYLKYLRDRSMEGKINDGLLKAWYMFPEVKQLWLGYSKDGNSGSGLGPKFAKALNQNLHAIFNNFGNEKITKGSHLEKVCLIDSGIGRDNISDFTANLIKEHLLDYTEVFTRNYIDKNLRCRKIIEKVAFNYEYGIWQSKEYELPYFAEEDDYVLLTPKDILTKDENWINRNDFIKDFERIASSVSDEQLRAQINRYLSMVLVKDEDKEPTKEEKEKAFYKLIETHPELIEYFIKYKELRGPEAIRQSKAKVSESEHFYILQIQNFVTMLARETEFYKHGCDTLHEARVRVQYLKEVIENNNGYRLFYQEGKPVAKESDFQILFKFTWLASPSDFNAEVNNGRGPVDFKISRGDKDKSLVEFKLAKNTKLKQNLQHQVEIYKKANKTDKSLKVIVFFSEQEKSRVDSILHELKLDKDDSIILIDARDDNKQSASIAR